MVGIKTKLGNTYIHLHTVSAINVKFSYNNYQGIHSLTFTLGFL